MPLMPIPELLSYIFSNTRLPLAVQFAHWVQDSPRFRVFAETYRDKIRKKVRGITEAEGYGDLMAELATAYFLVQERRFAVEYEKYGTGKQRGPDFSITYKTHIRFDVEVARIRGLRGGNGSQDVPAPDAGKISGTICTKLVQLLPSMINIVVLYADDVTYSVEDLENGLQSAIAILQERADRKDDEFFTRRGFLGARDFHRYYSRLSAIRLVTPDTPPVLRLQPQSRHPLPSDLLVILRR